MLLKFIVPALTLILGYYIAYSTSQQQHDPEFMKLYNESSTVCIQETQVDPQLLSQIWKDLRFPNDNKLKCYFKCLTLKLGVMDETGNVMDDGLKKIASQFETSKQLDEILTECKDIEGSHLCDTAYKLVSCILQAKLD